MRVLITAATYDHVSLMAKEAARILALIGVVGVIGKYVVVLSKLALDFWRLVQRVRLGSPHRCETPTTTILIDRV